MYYSEISILKLPTMATNSRLISLPSLCSTSKTHSYIQFFTPKNSFKFRNLSSASSGFFLTKKRTNLYPLVSALEKENGSIVVEEEGGEVELEDARLFVANLHFNVDSEKLAHLFQKAGIVVKAEVKYDRAGQSRCFGFVTMSTVEEAEKAVNMFNRYEVNGRLLDVTKAAPRGSRPPERTQRSYEIYVGNLPYDVDNSRLEQIFSEYGKVTSAKVVCERESGRSRGFGFVFMSSDSDRNNAVENLNGQSLNRRIIRVKVAEERRI